MMDFLTFCLVALTSTAMAAGWLFLTRVFPAYKAYKIQESLITLTQCLAHFSKGPLADGSIRKGYLHDRFYKLSFMVLTHKINLKYGMLRRLTPGPGQERTRFHQEMNSLDSETRLLVQKAILATAKILWLRNPVIFTLSILKQCRLSSDLKCQSGLASLRKQAMISAESMALTGTRHRDYEFVPIVH